MHLTRAPDASALVYALFRGVAKGSWISPALEPKLTTPMATEPDVAADANLFNSAEERPAAMAVLDDPDWWLALNAAEGPSGLDQAKSTCPP